MSYVKNGEVKVDLLSSTNALDVLDIIRNSDNGTYASKIARVHDKDRSNVSEILKAWEIVGMVEEVPSKEVLAAKYYSNTEKCEEYFKKKQKMEDLRQKADRLEKEATKEVYKNEDC